MKDRMNETNTTSVAVSANEGKKVLESMTMLIVLSPITKMMPSATTKVAGSRMPIVKPHVAIFATTLVPQKLAMVTSQNTQNTVANFSSAFSLNAGLNNVANAAVTK